MTDGPQGRIPLSALPARDWAAAGRVLEADGVVFLPGALDAGALAKAEAAVEFSLAHPSLSARRFYPKQTETFFEDRGSQHARVARDIGLDTMIAAMWGVGDVWYMGEQLFLKEGGHSRRAETRG